MTQSPSTEREAALAAALENVLRAVRHDLRGPLTAISTNVALLLEDPLTDEQRRALTDVGEGGRRIARMLSELEAAAHDALANQASTKT